MRVSANCLIRHHLSTSVHIHMRVSANCLIQHHLSTAVHIHMRVSANCLIQHHLSTSVHIQMRVSANCLIQHHLSEGQCKLPHHPAAFIHQVSTRVCLMLQHIDLPLHLVFFLYYMSLFSFYDFIIIIYI